MPNSTVFHTDNLEFMRLQPDNAFDLAIVDPPYGIKETSNDNVSRSKLAKSKAYTRKNWDDEPAPPEYFVELKRISKNQIIFGANHFIENIPDANSSCWLVWNKENGDNDFADAELAYTSFNSAVRLVSIRWAGMLQHDMKNKEIRIHPTQKPVKLYEWILLKYAKPGDIILDTHLGGGSSRIAAHRLGFDFVGLEIDGEYVKSEAERFKMVTAQKRMF